MSDAIIEAVSQILALPSVEIKTETTETIQQDNQKPTIDSLVQITEQIKTIAQEQAVSQTNIQQPESPESTKNSTTTESIETIAFQDRQSPIDDITKDVEAECLSTEALTEAVREILKTPLTIHLPSIEQPLASPSTETQQEIDIIDRQSTLPQETSEAVPRKAEESILQSTTVTTEAAEEATPETKQLSQDIKQEDQDVKTDSVTETVRQILATPVSVHLPSVDSTTETITTHPEEQVKTPSTDALTSHVEQVTTTEEATEQPTDIKKDEILESRKAPSVIETTQETTSEDRQPSIEDTIREVEAERLSSEVLTEAVREILATPLTVHLPSVEHTTETTTEIEHLDEKPSVDSLTQITEQIRSMISSPVTNKEEQVIQTTDTKDEVIPESTTTLSTKETVQEETSEDRPSLVDHATKELEAERLSSEALTEAVRQILTTPLTVHLPSVDDKVETIDSHERPSTDTATEITSQTDIIPAHLTTTEQIITTTEEPSADAIKKTEVHEDVTINSLTETVRQILATPPTIHLPSVEHKTETTTEIEQADEKPSVDSLTQITEQIKSMISSPVTRKEEQELETTDTKQEVIPESTKTSFVIETKQKTTSEDTTKENEAERLSSEALTEAVREILAAPLTVHLPSVEHPDEKPSVDFLTQITEQIRSMTSSPVTKKEEQVVETTDTKEEVIPEPSKTSFVIETKQETTSEDTEKETEVEHLTAEALTEAVREILATPLIVHLPSVEHTAETTTEIEHPDERPSVDSLTQIAEQIKSMTTLPVTTKDTEQEVIPESATTLFTKETVQERPSEDRPSLVDDATKEVEAERLLRESLTEAVREILATPLTVHLPSVDSTIEKATTRTEEQFERPSAEALNPSVEQVTTTELPTDIKKDEILESVNAPSVETIQETTSEERQSSEALTEVVREILATPLTVHLPSVDIRTKTTESTEKPLSTSSEETAQKIDEIAAEPVLEKRVTTTTVVEEAPIENQQSADEVNKEKEDETVSTDSLAETVRQILATPSSVHVPSIETKTETTNDVIESSDKKTIEGRSDSSPTELKAEDVQKALTDIHQPSAEKTEDMPFASSTEVVRDVVTTSIVDNKLETTVQSEEVKPSSDSLIEIVHQVLTSPVRSTTSDVKAEKEETASIQTQLDESIGKETVTTQLISPESDQIPLQSTITDISEQSNKESPAQDNVSTSELKLVPSESEISICSIVPIGSVSHSEDESLYDNDNESISSSLCATVDNIVTDAIIDACYLLEQPAPDQSDNQSLLTVSSTDDFAGKADLDTNSINDIVTESYDDDYSTSGLANIVHSLLNLPNQTSSELSLPREDNKIIVSSETNYDEQTNITELTNIVDTITKTLNTPPHSSEQSETSEETPLQRASAVKPTFIIDNEDDETPSDNVPTFYVPGTPTTSDAYFRDLYDHRHFISTATEEPVFKFTGIDTQGSVQSTSSSEEKKIISDSPLAYYELQEERHTLMSPQQSVNNEKEETKIPSLTTWTTIQPVIDYKETEKKEDLSDINLDDQSYEYARRFDLESPSVISNLSTSEYRQVLDIPDEVVNTVDDMTYYIAELLSKELENNQQLITSDEVKNLSELDENSQLEEEVQSSPFSKDASVSDNIRKITEALYALESDLLEQSSASRTVDHSISEQNILESERLSTALENDIKQTLEEHPSIIPSQVELPGEFIDQDSLPKEIKQETFDRKSTDEITSDIELDSRYSTLLDHIDNLEQSLIDLQPSSPLIDEKETITTAAITSEEPSVSTEKDIQSEITTTDSTITDEKAVRSVVSEDEDLVLKSSGEHETKEEVEQQQTSSTGLFEIMKDLLPTTLQPTKSDVISSEEQILTVENEKQKEISSPVPGYFTSSDVYHAYKQPTEPMIEEEHPSGLIDKATSIVSNIISSVTSALPTSKTTEETTISEEKVSIPSVIEEEIDVSKPSEEKEQVDEQQTSTTGLFEIMKSFLPSSIRSTKTDDTSYEEPISAVEEDQKPISSYVTETPSTREISQENLSQSIEPEVETEKQEYVLSPVPGYFISSDVYHAYKQPAEPLIEEKHPSGPIGKATSIVSNIISSVTSALPTSKTTEETTTSEEEIVVSKPSEEKEEVHEQQTSTTGLFEIMKSFLSSSIRSTKTDDTSYEEPISAVEEEDQETSSKADSFEESLSQSFESAVGSEKQEHVSSTVPDYISSSDVDYAYKEPEEAVVEEKHPSGLIDKATSIVSNIISSVTSALPTTIGSEEEIVSSNTSSLNEEKVESQSVTTTEKTTEMTELTVSNDQTLPSTVEEKEIVVSKPIEESETEADEVAQQPSSTGLFEIMKNLLSTTIRSKPSVITSSEEQIPTTNEDKEIVSSSTIETTTTPKVFEDYPVESTQSVTQVQQQDVSNQISSNTTKTDAIHAEKEPVEQVVEEKDSTNAISRLTSIVSDAISAVQHALPTSITSSTDVVEQKSPLEEDETETSESAVSE